MTGARNVGGASVAARRLLVLAGAVAGFWLVSWLTSAHADAATPGTPAHSVTLPGLPDPIGVVVGAPARGKGPSAARPVAADERRTAGIATASAARVPGTGRDVSPGAAGAVVGSVSRAAGAVVSPVTGSAAAVVSQVAASAKPVVAPVSPTAGAVVSPAASAASVVVEPVSRVVRSAGPVSRAAGAVVSPVTGGAAAVVGPVAKVVGSVSQGGGAIASSAAGAAAVVVEPVSRVVRSAEPISRAAEAVVSPVTGAAAAVVSQVAASAKPVVAPVSRVVGAVLTPVTGALAPVSRVVRSVEPILGSLTRPVAGLVDPLTRTVGGLVRPVLGTAAPGLTDVVAPVAADLPVVAPVTGGVGPAGRLPGTKPAGLIGLVHLADPVASSTGAAETLLPSGKFGPVAVLSVDVSRPMAPGSACHGTTEPGSHRASASAPQAVRPDGVPGHTPPAPASPAPSDAGCGAGSPIPPAFLASDHGPRDFRVVTRVHEVFVPLSRPCEPGTGPG